MLRKQNTEQEQSFHGFVRLIRAAKDKACLAKGTHDARLLLNRIRFCNRQAELVAYRNYRVVYPAGDGSAHTFRALPVSTMTIATLIGIVWV
jgi:hypothetical protein